VGETDAFTCEEIAYGIVSLCSKTSDDDSTPKLTTVVFPHKSTGLKLNEFTVEFEKGATGVVGWVEFTDNGADTPTSSINFARSYPRNGLFLNIAERKAYGPNNNNGNTILGENLRMNHTETVTKLVCRRVGGAHKTQRKYSIELADGTNVDTNIIDPQDSHNTRVMPVIAFSGKVTVSGLRYAIDEL